MNMLHDTSIHGLGRLEGGKYNAVNIFGKGTVTGDVEAVEIHIEGMGKIKGNTKASNLIIE